MKIVGTGRGGWGLVVAGGLALVVLLGGCEKAADEGADDTVAAVPEAVVREVRHVVLIVSDAMRKDALSLFNDRITGTENIAGLAAEGMLFTGAVSAASWTTPAMASIFSGTDPAVHMIGELNSILPEQFETLAEYMREAQYVTGAIGHNPNIVRRGLEQGFMTYDAWPDADKFGSVEPPNTEGLTDRALVWLDAHKDEKFFFYLHYLDPHMPYYPPEQYRSEIAQPPETAWNIFPDENQGEFPWVYRQRDKVRLMSNYLGEVRYVDDQMGRVMAHLKRLGLYEDALIIFVSDHGEEFWEHGDHGHATSLYNTLLGVPLIIKLPGQTVGKVVEQTCGTVSLLPTILEVCGIEYPAESFSAASLSGLWRGKGETAKHRAVFSRKGYTKEHQQYAVTWGDNKYMRWIGPAKDDYVTVQGKGRLAVEELYDLAKDPFEMISAVAAGSDLIGQGRARLERFEKDSERLRQYHESHEAETRELDERALAELKALGYVQ